MKKKNVFCCLALVCLAFMLPLTPLKAQLTSPAVFTPLPSNNSVQTGLLLNSTQQWFKYSLDSVHTAVTVKLQKQGSAYGLSKLELFKDAGGGLIKIVFTDSLRTDSSLSVIATNLSPPSQVYLRVTSVSRPCAGCAPSAFPQISLSAMALPVGCSAYVHPACQLVKDGGFEFATVPCGSIPNPNAGACSNDPYVGFASCFWTLPQPGNFVNCGSGLLPSLGTSDYFYGCNSAVGAHGGIGFAGAYIYTQTAPTATTYAERNYREYITQTLNTPLVAGRTYSVSLWVKRRPDMVFATANIQLAFSNSFYTQPGYNVIVNPPGQIINMASTPVTSTAWVQLTASFVANAAYPMVTIGNFAAVGSTAVANQNASQTLIDYRNAYYYFDDLSIKPVNNLSVSPANAISCGGVPVNLVATLSNNGTQVIPATYTIVPLWGTDPTLHYTSADYSHATVSPSVTSSYQVLGTDALGCASYSLITVNITPSVPFSLSATASGIPLCGGGTATLQASGATSYTWMPGMATGATQQVSPSVSTSYTVTAATNSCTPTQSAVVTVSVIAAPQINSLSVSSAYVCAGSSAVLTVVPATAGTYTYNWIPSAPHSASITVSPADNTIYYCSVANNCQATGISTCVDITCTLCCLPCNESFNGGSLTVSGFSNMNLCLSGTITINANSTWDNCNIRMASGTKIIVSPGRSLILKNTKLFSCQDMWEGITVLPASGSTPSASITVMGSTIEDAYKAISYDAQNGLFNGNISVSGSTFNKNYIGIYISNVASSATGLVLALNSTFSGRASATSPGNSLKCSSYYPGIKVRPYSGIYFNNQISNIHIGDQAFNPANANTFDNLDYGVYLNNSQVRVFKSNFKNMAGQGFTNNPPPPPLGVGVYATNSFYNAAHELHVEQCSFTNVYRGVDVSALNNYYITASQFSATVTDPTVYGNAAVYTSNTAVLGSIQQNRISNFTSGIYNGYTAAAAISGHLLTVFQNTITAGGTATAYCAKAITLYDGINAFGGFGNNLMFSSNNITQVQNGIDATNVKNSLRISNNSIALQYVSSGQRCGIRLNGCQNAYIDNNTVGSTGTANTSVRGIYLQLSPACRVQCNSINTVGQSVVFDNNCLSSTYGFFNNVLNTANDGLVLTNNGVIGQMGRYGTSIGLRQSANNQWLGTFSNSKTLVINAGSSALNSKMYVRNTAAENPQPQTMNKWAGTANPNIDNYGTAAWNTPASILVYTSLPFTCIAANTSGQKLAQADTEEDEDAKTIADAALYALLKDPAPDDPLGIPTAELCKAYVFNRLDHGYVTPHAGLKTFYQGQLGGTEDRFNLVDSLMMAGSYYAAQKQNELLDAKTSMQQNRQAVNTALLKQLQAPQAAYTAEEIESLQLLANKCPLKEGTAVYQARSLLCLLSKDNILFTDNCNVESGMRRALTATGDEAENYVLFPNPSTGAVSLRYTTAHKVHICVYDLSGRELYRRELDQASGLLQLELGLSQGMYLFSVITEQGKVLKTDKLLILP